jgi:hypothetical protein
MFAMTMTHASIHSSRFHTGSACWRRRVRRHWAVGMLALSLLLAACGGDEETPTPVPTSTPASAPAVAAAPTSPLSTLVADAVPTPTTEAVAAQTPVTSEVTASPVATVSAEPSITATGANTGASPLEVDEGAGCAIESNLDLVGYPNLEERMGCPVDEARFDPIGINEFGDLPPYDRFMLWFSHEKQIYVLYPNGSYETFPDTWVEDQDPTYSCDPLGSGEPDSPPLPRRGFGKLWCNNPQIQEVMGTVPREERLCQHAVLQRFEAGQLLACFEDATIRYFRLLQNNTWDVTVQ